MRDGPEVGLAALDHLLAGGELDGYQLAHAARADFCRRLGRNAEARKAYARAIELTAQGPARRFLEKRLAALPRLKSETWDYRKISSPRCRIQRLTVRQTLTRRSP